MKAISLIVSMLLCLCQPSFGYSKPGHQAIVKAALKMLQGKPAAAKVKQILGKEQPSYAATWLDDVRENALKTAAEKAEAKEFSQHFPLHPNWHFTNYIVGSTKYDLRGKYSTDSDVVHALENAISVLEGASSPMTKRQALRVVIHLVGDIH